MDKKGDFPSRRPDIGRAYYGLQQGAGTLVWYSVIPIRYVGETCTVTWCRQSLRLYGNTTSRRSGSTFAVQVRALAHAVDGDTEGADVAAAVAYLLGYGHC